MNQTPLNANPHRRSAVLAKYAAADPVGTAAPETPTVGQCTGDRRVPGTTPAAVPSAAGPSFASCTASAPECARFEQRHALYRWLHSFPPESIHRITTINNAAGSAKHVLLALAFGVYDTHVRKLNNVIIGLQVRRLRAERHHDARTIEVIQNKLNDLHHAIDWVCGTIPLFTERPGEIAACNRLKKDAA